MTMGERTVRTGDMDYRGTHIIKKERREGKKMLKHKLIISAPTDTGQRWAFSYIELRLFGHRFFLSEKLAEIKAPEEGGFYRFT